MKTMLILLFLLSLISCMKTEIYQDPFDPITNGYQLIWSDEFDGNSLDTTKWSFRNLGPRALAINIKKSVFLNGNGQLAITVTKNISKYYTGMIGTQNKFENLYGYYECRVRMNSMVGPHSAFWLQSPLIHQMGEPSQIGTEMDIYEYMPILPNNVQHNLHWDYSDSIKNTGKVIHYPQIKQGFHTLGMEWDVNGYTFYVDGYETFQTDSAISHIPQYIILSTEYTGGWGEIQSETSDTVLFDYIRVFKK